MKYVTNARFALTARPCQADLPKAEPGVTAQHCSLDQKRLTRQRLAHCAGGGIEPYTFSLPSRGKTVDTGR